MIVLALHPGLSDASAVLFDEYRVLGAVQHERLSRSKGDGVHSKAWAWACADELLAMAGLTRQQVDAVALSRGAMPSAFARKNPQSGQSFAAAKGDNSTEPSPFFLLDTALFHAGSSDAETVFDSAAFLQASGLRADVTVHYSNHHRCHALPALFFTDWDEALIYTADGGGDNAFSSARSFRDGMVQELFGGDETLLQQRSNANSLGLAYGVATEMLGFRMMRHEGKVTGLAACGQPRFYPALAEHFTVHDSGEITTDWPTLAAMRAGMEQICAGGSPQDIACSVQTLLETCLERAVKTLLTRHAHRRLGLAGGVFANVKLNRHLAESCDLEELFIVPAMGDEGLSLGAGLDYLLTRDGLSAWLKQRYRLETVYWGRDYDHAGQATFEQTAGLRKTSEAPAEGAAERLAGGEIGAIYSGRMEFGPRALGARTILANPARRDTHDELNRRLSRSEFMPFAPVIRAERAAEVFEITPQIAYACRFMTITTGVRAAWREKIAAVVHVDHSARPQVIDGQHNRLYGDILEAFERKTSLPVLINTSFNVHEEPIVNAPAEAIRALCDGRIDFLVTPHGLYVRS